MHASAQPTDGPSPSAGADLILVAALLGVLTGLAWGVIWVQNAFESAAGPAWLGTIPPAVTGVCAAALLAVRGAYEPLPRLRRFLTRMAFVGLGGALVLGALAAWITLGTA